ncbi:MAG: zinc ribbon domain-containing protein [Verrucomicrobiota bacterium]|nr:zinc ribbon domain-containing protein [Verrucomicrobiota bacterium]
MPEPSQEVYHCPSCGALVSAELDAERTCGECGYELGKSLSITPRIAEQMTATAKGAVVQRNATIRRRPAILAPVPSEAMTVGEVKTEGKTDSQRAPDKIVSDDGYKKLAWRRKGRISKSGRQRHHRGEAKQEADWMGSHVMSLWWVLAGLLCIVVLGVFLSRSFDIPVNPPSLEEPDRLTMIEGLSDDPIAEFVARGDEILPKIADLLGKVNSAEGPELAKFIRGGEESRLRRLAWLERKAVPARHYPITKRELRAASSGKYAYLIVVGLGPDHLQAVAYFTKEDDSFKYDWEASEGYSEILPGETDRLTGEESKLMRCIVKPSNFYTPSFPEEEFQSYTLHHSDPGEFVWAFARRSSEGNKRIMSHFSGRVFMPTVGRVTIRVRKGPQGARSNQVEIVEFIHPDWFTPTVIPEP